MTHSGYPPGTILDDVPIFPLPQVVLFPGAVMPLHIFEPRYRAMTRDALAADRRLAVVQIPEHHDRDDHGRPEIASVTGVGEIVEHETLDDGRYNILVRGLARASVEELPPTVQYRTARLTVLETVETPVDDVDVRALRAAALDFARRVSRGHAGFRFTLPEAGSPGALADACSHYLIVDGAERQSLLEMLDDRTRLQRCLECLLAQQAEMGGDETLH